MDTLFLYAPSLGHWDTGVWAGAALDDGVRQADVLAAEAHPAPLAKMGRSVIQPPLSTLYMEILGASLIKTY
jgi:hypothetical protein